MKRYDFYLAGAVILIALAWFLLNVNKEQGTKVCVYINNTLVNTLSLSDDGEYFIGDKDMPIISYTISNGKLDVKYSDCPDKLCVHQKAISKSSESIVCLPNKVMFLIEGSVSNEFDAIGY